jgi:hypothetical protein
MCNRLRSLPCSKPSVAWRDAGCGRRTVRLLVSREINEARNLEDRPEMNMNRGGLGLLDAWKIRGRVHLDSGCRVAWRCD